MEEALDPAELAQRGMLAEYDHEVLGRVRGLGTPLVLDGSSPRYRAAPRLGADNAALLEELGYDEGERRRLAEAGAFGPVRIAGRSGAVAGSA